MVVVAGNAGSAAGPLHNIHQSTFADFQRRHASRRCCGEARDCDDKLMTKAEELIREVLAIDEQATPGPWTVDDESWKEVNDITVYGPPLNGEPTCVCGMGCPIAACDDAEEAEISYKNGCAVAHYRTSAPKLARMLKIWKIALEELARSSDLPGLASAALLEAERIAEEQ